MISFSFSFYSFESPSLLIFSVATLNASFICFSTPPSSKTFRPAAVDPKAIL